MNEVFKPIPGFPGYYVSNLGRIKSMKRKEPIIMSTHNTRLGYLVVMLWNNNKLTQFYVSRLVLEVFRGYPTDPWLCYAHHKNGNLNDCRLENLEWNICETTDEYDPEVSHRRGVLKPDETKKRMTEAKYKQGQETIRKAAMTRSCTMRLNKYIEKIWERRENPEERRDS